MKRLFFLGCAVLTLTFASCKSNKTAEQTDDKNTTTTEQATEVKAEVKEVVNEVLVALEKKLAAFKAKVEASTKADAATLLTEAKGIKDEIDAAALTEAEKSGLVDTFNAIIEIAKNLK